MHDDRSLLLLYASHRDEAAFAQLVHRHINLVYSSALRRVGGDPHAASDIVQRVFVAVARHARSLADHAAFSAWLFAATRNAAIDYLRRERRRHVSEQDAVTLRAMSATTGDEPNWTQLRPVLDGALDELDQQDRAAVLLRFFQNCSFPEIGEALKLSEDAARMRVGRALKKLRDLLAKRGVNSSAAALAQLLAQNGIVGAPTGLAAVVTGSAVNYAPFAAAASGSLLGSVTMANTSIVITATAVAAAVAFAVIQARSREPEQAAPPVAASAVSPATSEMAVQFNPSFGRPNRGDTDVPSIARQRTTTRDDEAINTGRQFLASHPEAQSALAAVRHRMFEHTWGFALRQMNLTSRERDEIERRVCDALPWAFAIETRSWEFGFGSAAFTEIGQVAERELRSALGDAGFEVYRECCARRPVYELVQAVAVAAYEAGSPLTPAQTTALVEAILRHGSQRREIAMGSPLPGARLTSMDLRPVDWNLLSREVGRILEPKQLAALDAGKRSFEAGKLEERAKASLGETAAISGSPQQNSWDNTQLQARAVERFGADLPVKYAQFYRLRGLDDAAIASFEKLMTDFEASRRDLRATERTIPPSGPHAETREAITVDGRRVRVAVDRSIATLQRQEEERFRTAAVGLLSGDGYADLQAFEGGAEARALVAEFVSERALSATPVSLEQGQRLTSELRNLNYGRKIEPQDNRWDDIAARGRSILTQDQMPAWEAFITQARGIALSTQLSRWIDAWRKAN